MLRFDSEQLFKFDPYINFWNSFAFGGTTKSEDWKGLQPRAVKIFASLPGRKMFYVQNLYVWVLNWKSDWISSKKWKFLSSPVSFPSTEKSKVKIEKLKKTHFRKNKEQSLFYLLKKSGRC